ncbi:MAG: TIGR03084 family metal-binding protein [Blastomonas sp.]
MEQAEHFRNESEKIAALLAAQPLDWLDQTTGFKRWSVADIVGHLYVWNRAALLSLSDAAGFAAFLERISGAFRRGGDLKTFERDLTGEFAGQDLVDAWCDSVAETAKAFAKADPKARLPWVGPEMSARSSITARLMESWAHGQAIFDLAGVERVEGDALRDIAMLGYNTYGWTFRNRRETPPEPRPSLALTAPSGEIWRFGEADPDENIAGQAVEFCQVVTQTRNIADTGLALTGPNAHRWMEIAQCFAGAPVEPPAAGERRCGQVNAGC